MQAKASYNQPMATPRFVKWIFKDWWLKILALIAAILLWLFARLELTYTRELKLKLDTSLLPPEYIVVDKNTDAVIAEIKAKGRYLIRLNRYEPKIVLPLATMGEGRERIRIGPENVDLPEEIIVRSLDPYQIELTIRKRSKRKIRVIVPAEGIPAPDFAISGIDYNESVSLYGETTLNQLFTEPLNVDGVSESFDRMLAIQVPRGDSGELLVMPSSIKVKVTVEPETTVVLSGIPVGIRGKPVQGQAFLLKKEVKLALRGPVSLLRNLKKEDVKVTVSVSALGLGSHQVPADVEVAPGIKVENSEPAIFQLLVR